MQHTIQLEAVATARLLGSSWLATGPQNTNTTVSGINDGETAVNRAFIRFGDFEIPSYANIVSATLQVYVSARSSSSGYTHYIFPITDSGTLWTPQSRNCLLYTSGGRNGRAGAGGHRAAAERGGATGHIRRASGHGRFFRRRRFGPGYGGRLGLRL